MKSIAFAVCACLLALASPARADIGDIRAADNAAYAAGGIDRFKYGEDVNNATFDTEHGNLLHLRAGYSFLTGEKASVLSNFFGDLRLDFSNGNSNYNGGLTNLTTGITVPAQSTTHNQIAQLETRWGKAYPIGNMTVLTPYTDIGYRYWQRELTGTGSYTERYTNGILTGGAMVQISPVHALVVTTWGEAGTTFNPGMKTQGTHYSLGTTKLWNVGVKVGYAMTDRLELTGSGDMTGFGFGQSQMVGTSYEPNSYTHETSVLVGFAYHLH